MNSPSPEDIRASVEAILQRLGQQVQETTFQVIYDQREGFRRGLNNALADELEAMAERLKAYAADLRARGNENATD